LSIDAEEQIYFIYSTHLLNKSAKVEGKQEMN